MSEEECDGTSVPVCARRCSRVERCEVRAGPNDGCGGPDRMMGASEREASSKLQISVCCCQ